MPPKEDKKPAIPLPVYESHPPDWLPKTHASGDLGYIGFYPPRPGQDEDLLSEANVRNGFILGQTVSSETFSGPVMTNAYLREAESLATLENLMNEIFTRRADRVPPIPPSTFRMPSRVTLNDAKRQAWFADLANPEVPLYKLGKSVPHGAKGHDLLDLLQSNNVAISRAVWLLRVFGANETAGLRNRPSYNPTQYSIEWANVVTSYMKKQLADIALPSAPRPGLNIKQTFKGVLADADTRERWISRFTYCLKLLRTFYSEGLVDNRTFLVWVVQQMNACNLAQAGFLARLADDYLDGMLRCRALARPFIEGCLAKLLEIRASAAQELLLGTEALLKTLLQRFCLAIPDAFVSPRMWNMHSTFLVQALTETVAHPSNQQLIEQNSQEIQYILLDNLADIRRRNEAMLFRNLPPRGLARLGSSVADVQLLNSISRNTDMEDVQFFDIDSDDSAAFVDKLDLLLTWSVTPRQYGDHRPFAAVTLLRNWRDKAGARATRRDCTPPDERLQDQLFDWLDSSEAAGDPESIRAVTLIFGKLVKHGLFSYASYIQRLIARGEPGLASSEVGVSRHRNFLRCMPLYDSSASLISQRKVTLYGVRARETPEDLNEREIRKEIRTILPELFGGDPSPSFLSTTTLLSNCSAMLLASRFEQVRTFRMWLLPILRRQIPNHTDGSSEPNLLRSYCMSVELMYHAKCFEAILELSQFVLERCTTMDLLTAVIDTFHRFALIWTCINANAIITTALYNTHQIWRARGIQSRGLLALLMQVDNGRHLHPASREQVAADISAFTLALEPRSDHANPVPSVLPEILLLAGDPHVDAPSILANGLWFKYRMSTDWAWKVWDNAVASLRQVPQMTPDVIDRRACALRYGAFLLHVDQHLPSGLDDHVLRWFLGPGKKEIAGLSTDIWDALTVVLLYLVVHGALKTTTILKGLVYPAWQLGTLGSGGQSLEVFLGAANNLFESMLFREDGSGDLMPPTDIFDLQCIRTRRQDAYTEPHFSLLVASVPVLVSLENREELSESLRQEFASLRCALCKDPDFRQGAYRNLDAVRDAFGQSLQPGEAGESLGEPIISALKMILCETSNNVDLSSWPEISCLLSPWKLSGTAIQLQFNLRQMGRALSQDSTFQDASAGLDKLTSMIFRHSMTPEEAYFVAELTRDVDSAVAGKFVNNGLKCITEILNSLSVESDDFVKGIKRLGELLRALTHIAEPWRDDPSLLPPLVGDIQEQFILLVCSQFEAVESLLSAKDQISKHAPSDIARSVAVLARLVQFSLGFRDPWSAKRKENSSTLPSTLFRLILSYCAGTTQDLVVSSILIDTLYYLIDEIPSDMKALTFDPFKNYPQLPSSGIPLGVPPEYRDQLRSLIPHHANSVVSQLVNAHRDADGKLSHSGPVVNRPWEWIENLGDATVLDPKEMEKEQAEKERLNARYLVKNSGSISLDSFEARMTNEGIPQNMDDHGDSRMEINLRSFEDGLSSETIYKRDWRETRVELEVEALVGGAVGKMKGGEGLDLNSGLTSSSTPTQAKSDRRTTPRASPASSIPSRASAHHSGGSLASSRISPGQTSMNRLSTSTISEPVDVDALSTTSTSRKGPGKRKAAAPLSDDDIEIIEGPVPGPARAAKKTKAKAAPKARAKKR